MSDAPEFWFAPRGGMAYALAPAAALYGRIAGRRMAARPSGEVDVPVVCVGNFIVGGAGKTPVALEVARIAEATGRRPGFLSRGYGGAAPMPLVVDPERHTSRDVGDEPLMLAARAPTVVSPDRVAGAKLLVRQDVDLVVMDDGFQNPALARDLNLVVLGARRGIGNGFAMPAGPLRADLSMQIAQAHAIVVVSQAGGKRGDGEHPSVAETVRRAARRALPILRASIEPSVEPDVEPEGGDTFAGRRLLAFAGIGDPEKFFRTLSELGAEIVDRQAFDDHHVYDEDAIADLVARADKGELALVTTEKDAARLAGRGAAAEALLARTEILRVRLAFEDERHVRRLLADAHVRAKERRLG